jgi:hypothetical protein
MLAAVEFDNQMTRDAAVIGKVGANPVLPAESESATALSSEVPPTTSAPRKSSQYEDAGLDRADFRLRNS